MNAKTFLFDAAITIPVTFVVAAAVTYLYGLIAHASGQVNWETAFQLAIVLGLVLPFTRARDAGPTRR
ncbi:MAG: hypothetical protein R6X25_16455 [Candidatus Krumholzibacteriia bacterium]